MGEFYITERWLKAHGTRAAGWTAAQLRVLGVPWPPRKGWLKQLVGVSVTQAQREAFEIIGAEQRARKRVHHG